MNLALTMPLKCVSLWQPWASLVAAGVKTVETRSWAIPYSLLGSRIGIHAAKTHMGINLAKEDPELWGCCVRHLGWELPQISEECCILPFGMLVATAVVEACFPVERLVPDVFGDYSPGRFGWVLSGVEKLVEPVPIKGRQGIFTVYPGASA